MENPEPNFCPVCLDATENKISCNHICCETCIKKVIKMNGLCPLCRNDFDKEPYRYKPPKHKPNLKLTTTQIRTWNRFLNNRVFLYGCKKQRIFSYLLYRYVDLICFENKYLDLNAMAFGTIRYDVNWLVDIIFWLQNKNKLYTTATKNYAIYQIRLYLSRLI